MKSKIEEIGRQRFAFLRRTGPYGAENGILMVRFKDWLKENGYFKENPTVYALVRDSKQTTLPENCRYDVGMIVKEDFTHPDLKVESLEGGKYLVFQIEHTEKAVSDFWVHLMEILLKEGFQIDETRCPIERYEATLLQKELCEICIPVC